MSEASDGTVWQSDWPSEPGLWWFCGYRHHRDKQPTKILCDIAAGREGQLEAFEGPNVAVNPRGCGLHFWARAVVPVAPPEILATMDDDQGNHPDASATS